MNARGGRRARIKPNAGAACYCRASLLSRSILSRPEYAIMFYVFASPLHAWSMRLVLVIVFHSRKPAQNEIDGYGDGLKTFRFCDV